MTKIQTGPFTISLRADRPALTAGRFQIPQDTFTIQARGIHIRNHRWALSFRSNDRRPLTVTRAAGPVDPGYSLALLR